MSLFRKNKPQADERSYGAGYFTSANQLIPLRPPYTTGGVPVTANTALSKIALMAGTNLVADMPGILPVQSYTGQGGERRPVRLPANVSDPEGDGYGLADFAYKYIACRILRGNVFLRVEDVDAMGRPQVVTLLNPDEVTVYRDLVSGRWKFKALDGKPLNAFAQQPIGGIIHRRAFPQPGSALGLSAVANHARTIGLSIASEQFGADFFGDGAHPSAILSTDQPVTEDQAKTIKQRFVNAIRGSREPAVLGAGMTYSQIQIAPNESQFLETQKFTAVEVCRMIGPGVAEMLGYETGGHMTYQNVESRSLHLLVYTANKWLRDLENLLSDVFVARKQTIEFDRNGLLQMVPGDRWAMYKTQLITGGRVINEVRADEGWGPVPWGDEPFLPSFGTTGTAAAETLQVDSMDGQLDGKFGKITVDVPPAPKIGGTAS